MASKTVIVASAEGLHARPAGLIAEAAEKYDTDIELSTEGEDPVDAASSMMIMALGAEKGVEVTVTSDDEAAVEEIAKLIETDLDA
ncbi:MAG TPA: HPr family phosphocarrier protein [Dietzia timorensis]|uniref:HPr family phosphocarrier protein n=1 Tax=Dietzia timorensis TaxID=499555 RepID=A0A921JWV8_9ACTN|nr:HPr family phosphocarrier protein [Dietzia timorensis]HJE89630.1 HPr family phosphocarrier protein [Dietzia timorensis]